jgi:hypothetical protein
VRIPDSVHEEYAGKAWQAVERSFIRYPDHAAAAKAIKSSKAQFLAKCKELSLLGTATKWLKFHSSYAFGKGFGQAELPTDPTGNEAKDLYGCFTPCLKRVMRRAMKRAEGGNWAYRRFLLDVLMSKSGMPPSLKPFVDGALADHRKALTQRTKAPEGVLDFIIYSHTIEAVKKEIMREVRRLFHGKVFEHVDAFPSVSASFENPLSEGGGFAQLVNDFDVPIDIIQPDGTVDDAALVGAFQNYVDHTWLQRLPQPLECIPIPILEPLKVRIITKAQAAENYRTLELQKMMHSVLRQHPVFEFIGKPIDDRSFSACFGHLGRLAPDEFFVSGDYKAATDNLDPALSLWAWECICREVTVQWQGQERLLFDTPYHDLGRKALTGHRINYKDSTVLQTWGQLMGSPMSFPILCLINSAATHVALRMKFSRFSKMRINGDDIGFIANPDSYDTWKGVTAACGLEFSMGKNYTSREFLIMNSELRRVPAAFNEKVPRYFYTQGRVEGSYDSLEQPERQELVWHEGAVWRYEGWFNQSICYSVVRKGIDAGKPKDVYWTDLGALSEALLRGINKSAQSVVMSEFLTANKTVVSERPVGCNLFIPRCLGGAGLQTPADKTPEEVLELTSPAVLTRELKRAAYLATHGTRRLQLPRVTIPDQGLVAKAVKAVRSQGPEPIARPIWENSHDLGLNGTQLLSRVIQRYKEYRYSGTECALPETRSGDPVWNGRPGVSEACHRGRNARLNRLYREFVQGDYSALQPMGHSKVFRFEETEQLMTLWPVTEEPVTGRDLDWYPFEII